MKKSALALASAAALIGCGGNQQNANNLGGTNFTDQPKNNASRTLSGSAEFLAKGSGAKTVSAAADLGFKVFLEAAKNREGENVLISPIGLASELATVYNGAAGETRTAIATAMEIAKVKPQDLNDSIKAIGEAIASSDEDKVDFKMGTSLWTNDGEELKSDFLKLNRAYFHAHAASAKLSDKAGIEAVNKWVGASTSGQIKSALSEPETAPLALVGTTSFHGEWTAAFDADKTRVEKFQTAQGDATSAQMMSREGTYSHLKNELFEAVHLPFGKGRMSMIVVLPATDPASVMKQLSGANWLKWMDEFKEEEGLVEIPKFTLASENDLSKELSSLGMGVAFTPQADFSSMSKGKLYLGKVKHLTYLQIDEAGPEIAKKASGGDPSAEQKGFALTANRPFLYAIVDDGTKAVLLVGVFNKPPTAP